MKIIQKWTWICIWGRYLLTFRKLEKAAVFVRILILLCCFTFGWCYSSPTLAPASSPYVHYQCLVGGVQNQRFKIHAESALVLSLPHTQSVTSTSTWGSLKSLQYVCICISFCQNSLGDRVRAGRECCFVWIAERLFLLMVYIIQVPSRHAFRNSFAWGNGEQRPGF